MEWSRKQYNKQYENWMPWVEDKYLYWFGKDNKASYVAKDSLSKTKVTGIEQVDNLQDGINNTAGGLVGKGGLAQPLGDAASKEGVNRMERGGKDDAGNTVPGGHDKDATQGVMDGAKGYAGSATDGVKGAGGYVGGMFGGGGKEEKK